MLGRLLIFFPLASAFGATGAGAPAKSGRRRPRAYIRETLPDEQG